MPPRDERQSHSGFNVIRGEDGETVVGRSYVGRGPRGNEQRVGGEAHCGLQGRQRDVSSSGWTCRPLIVDGAMHETPQDRGLTVFL